MATTVQDIRTEFLRLFPDFQEVGEATDEDLLVWQKLVDFWVKLNKLGSRNMDTIPPETVPNMDATVELADQECADLRAEIAKLEVYKAVTLRQS